MSSGYLSLTDSDREEMLAAIGVSSVEELFEQVPEGVRLDRELQVPRALGEAELVRHIEELAARNAHTGAELSFLGAGIYDHYVPSVVDVVLSRGEFLTAYTPYQPEMSQGVLQAIFEYQTVICELTGMDVSNASGYDGTTVAADAVFVAKHALPDRKKVVLAETLNPQVRQVVKTYAPGFGLEVVEVPHENGVTDPDRIAEVAGDAAAVLIQQPNFLGALEPAPDLVSAANDAGALPIVHVDPMSLGVLEAPGAYGAAIAIGEGQAAGQLAVVRRAALRLSRRPQRLHPSHAGQDRRRDGGRRRPPRVRAHAPDARAAHPPREGDVEHHDQPDAPRARGTRDPFVARPARAARGGADVPRARPVRAAAHHARARVRRAVVQGGRVPHADPGARRRPAARASTASTRATRLGRDYEGMDDVLLVALTEKRTVEDVDRLADVLEEVCA